MIAGGVSARNTQIYTNAVQCVSTVYTKDTNTRKYRTCVEFHTKSDAQVEDVIAAGVSTRGRQET